MENLFDVIDFSQLATNGFNSVNYGSAHDFSYVENAYMDHFWFTYMFANNTLTQEKFDLFCAHTQSRGRKATLQVVSGTTNEEFCIDHHMQDVDTTAWMGMHTSVLDRTGLRDIRVKCGSVPLSEDFLRIFFDAYINNDGLGFSYTDDCIDAYRNLKPVEELDERAYVAYEGSMPVSCALISVQKSEARAFVSNVATRKISRGKGYSRALLTRIISELSRDSITDVYLDTEADSPLQGFYESLGFSVIGTTKMYVPTEKTEEKTVTEPETKTLRIAS